MIVLVCLETPQPGRAAKAAELLARRLAAGASTIAVCAGGPSESEALTWAMGRRSFQRILHLDDASLAEADFMTVATVLSEVARHTRADVILVGECSDGEGQGLVPAALAHQLQARFIARAQDVRLTDSGRIEVTVPAAGRLCTLACTVPVVIAATAGCDDGAGVDAAIPASRVETISLGQLGLDPSRLVPRPELLGVRVPAPPERFCPMTPEQAARFIWRRH